MPSTRQALEARLNDFDPVARREALEALMDLAARGAVELPAAGRAVNVHCHSFFSFNGYGYSPTCIAWKARCAGLAVVGLIDFDVLDGVDEFLEACRRLGLRACAGLETRVYVPEFAAREINSPGEPGIAYHLATGFTRTALSEPDMLARLGETAQARNRTVVERVNPFLSPVALDYERDVLPLTPGGNATERHLCIAYDRKARVLLPEDGARAAFWAEKLDADPGVLERMAADEPVFQAFIRSKLMKAGGVGYMKPEGSDFPAFEEVNRFMLSAGAVPAYGWLDGTSRGERDIDELLDLMTGAGVAALNVIPDRNWNVKDPETRQAKVAQLHRIVDIAATRGLPILAGTEMNAHGQRFVDDFDAPEMAPLVGPALEGGLILYAHTLLEPRGMGYLSPWARSRFSSVAEKNAFFNQFGGGVEPDSPEVVERLGPEMNPAQALAKLDNGPPPG